VGRASRKFERARLGGLLELLQKNRRTPCNPKVSRKGVLVANGIWDRLWGGKGGEKRRTACLGSVTVIST